MMLHYQTHLNTLIERYQKALDRAGFDAVVISSGPLLTIAEDDRSLPYTPRAFAQQWLPYDLDPDSYIIFRPGEKPRLIWPARADFWHLVPEAPSGDWTALWHIVAATQVADWCSQLTGRIAWLGPQPADAGHAEVDPPRLKAELSYYRAYKTDFELACMTAASRKGVQGHWAAQQAFIGGGSEADIYRAFLSASEQLEIDEPYSGIVALNEAAATLHYERRRFMPPAQHRTLLIDAGAKVNGYASDITRTHTHDDGHFAALLGSMERLQKNLCQAVLPGVSMQHLHQQALTGVAAILLEHRLCRLPIDEQLAKRIPQAFYPHGLGHLLGLQVHDVGGHQQDIDGTIKPDEDAPTLRLTRRLEAGMVTTIEPGLYFIPMLLNELMQRQPQHGLDVELIDQLTAFGGIRIEDNLVVTPQGHRNLTREAFGY